jgi:pyruvate-formate lyase-activating enzyme
MNSERFSKGIYRGAKTLSIMPTFTCPAACKSCGTVSSPRDSTNLDLATIIEAIRQAKELGFANVVFTGGEATLRWEDLLQSIAYAHSLELPTRIVTNAHWAISLDKAVKCLDELIKHGLDEINYSTGDEHSRFIPVDNVMNAVVAAARRHFRVHVMVELREHRRVTKAMLLNHPLFSELTSSEKEVVSIGESPWMPLNPLITEEYPLGAAVNKQNVSLKKGCDSVLATYTLQADGRVGSCCGLGLRLIPELNVTVAQENSFLEEAIEDSEDDFMKLWLHYKGPEKVLAWVAEKAPKVKWENMYAHPCQACHRVYKDPQVKSVIFEHYTEIIADVLQSAWLDEEYVPKSMALSKLKNRT